MGSRFAANPSYADDQLPTPNRVRTDNSFRVMSEHTHRKGHVFQSERERHRTIEIVMSVTQRFPPAGEIATTRCDKDLGRELSQGPSQNSKFLERHARSDAA